MDKIIRHSLGNIFVDGIYCDTQPRTIPVDKIIRHTQGNIIVDGVYFDTQPRTIVVDKIIRPTRSNTVLDVGSSGLHALHETKSPLSF